MMAEPQTVGDGSVAGPAAPRGSPSPVWGWGEAAVAAGSVLCIVAAAALPWARADVTWRSVLSGEDVALGSFSFRLTDNPWLAATLICLAAACMAGMLWRRRAGTVAVVTSLLLLGGSAAYVISLIEDAYDFLGFYARLLELVRSFPLVGPVVESVIRERLSITAFPHAGFYAFVISALLILAGGLLIRRSSRVHV